jgi:hypothetical protein
MRMGVCGNSLWSFHWSKYVKETET